MPTICTLPKAYLPRFLGDGDGHAAQRLFLHQQPSAAIERCALTDVIHARDGGDEVRARKAARYGAQLRRGIKPGLPAVCAAGGEQPRLVLLEIDRRDAGDGGQRQPVLPEDLPDGSTSQTGSDCDIMVKLSLSDAAGAADCRMTLTMQGKYDYTYFDTGNSGSIRTIEKRTVITWESPEITKGLKETEGA